MDPSSPNDNVGNEGQNGEKTIAAEEVVQSTESKRYLKKIKKKQQRSDEEQIERQLKKRKARQETKNATRFVTPKAQYSFAHGYRMVEPYVYEFRTYAKERWFGKNLLSVFTKEFGANSPEYYKFAIQSGRITVNHQIVPQSTVVKNGDLIIHKAHRHEPPVSRDEIKYVYEDDDVLVVSKPPSIPTHPCGAYRHNSLHSIVQHSRPDLPQLNIVHRLDRLTSGIVLFAKTAAKAKSLSLCIADRQASKTYLARVRGHFSSVFDDVTKEKLMQLAQSKCAASQLSFPQEDQILISCPLRCLSARDAIWECHEEGKPSETLIRLIRTDTDTSLVECKPITGRTHQIRLHLQLIGFPIANDPCYGGELHFGESPERLEEIAAAKRAKEQQQPVQEVDFASPRHENESEEAFMRRTCTWCTVGEAEAFNETQLHCSKIWLHALEYKLDGHVFRVPEPSWASASNDY